MQNVYLLGGLTLGVLCVYKSWDYGKRKMYEYIMSQVNAELNKRMVVEEEQEFFKPMHKNSAIIKVQHAGKSHSVYVPYDRRKSSSMLSKKVYLVQGDIKTDISQKPGIPYLVSASQLGGTHIMVEDLSSVVLKIYEADEIPGYL